MGVVILASVLSFLALCSGITAVGSGSRWQYQAKDILKGRKNALLYIWVTLSTIFSMVHTAACIKYVLLPVWGTGPSIQIWFAIHACVAFMLTLAHGYIYLVMKRDGDRPVYLWGSPVA